jgi:hypothetical protein
MTGIQIRGRRATTKRPLVALAVLDLFGCALFGCAGAGSPTPGGSVSDAATGDASAIVDGARPSVSDAGCPDVSGPSPPSGACSGNSRCFVTPQVTCGPGVVAIPASPTVYLCSCTSDLWQCTIQGGGYGLIPCDAGRD